jgi:hypothetical protein
VRKPQTSETPSAPMSIFFIDLVPAASMHKKERATRRNRFGGDEGTGMCLTAVYSPDTGKDIQCKLSLKEGGRLWKHSKAY